MRLDKFFSEQGILSRKEVKPLIKKGFIKVNQQAAQKAEQKIDTQQDKIFLYNKEIVYKPFLYLMLNKPKGVVSATDDKINKTVLDLVPPHLYREGMFPAGRLDKDTTGFVLLTNDGDFAHRMLSPKSHIEKEYLVRLDAPVLEADRKRLEQGIVLADGYQCLPCKLTLIEDSATPVFSVTLWEGKYHQIKRMFGVVGCGVNELKRVRLGDVELDKTLPEGACREMLHKEVENILFKKY